MGDELRICEAPNRPMMKAINEELGKVVFFQPRCKLWSCPACSEVNKRLWTVKVYHGAMTLLDLGETLYMITLTSHERLSREGSVNVWPKAWKKLHSRAKYRQRTAQYVLIPERHKSGKLHVHLISTWSMKQKWWKDNARECGLGYQNRVREVKEPAIAAWYVSKYVGKSIADEEWPRGFRRVRVSQQWPKLPRGELPNWRFSVVDKKETLSEAVARMRESGLEVEILDHRAAWEYIAAIEGELNEQ